MNVEADIERSRASGGLIVSAQFLARDVFVAKLKFLYGDHVSVSIANRAKINKESRVISGVMPCLVATVTADLVLYSNTTVRELAALVSEQLHNAFYAGRGNLNTKENQYIHSIAQNMTINLFGQADVKRSNVFVSNAMGHVYLVAGEFKLLVFDVTYILDQTLWHTWYAIESPHFG